MIDMSGINCANTISFKSKAEKNLVSTQNPFDTVDETVKKASEAMLGATALVSSALAGINKKSKVFEIPETLEVCTPKVFKMNEKELQAWSEKIVKSIEKEANETRDLSNLETEHKTNCATIYRSIEAIDKDENSDELAITETIEPLPGRINIMKNIHFISRNYTPDGKLYESCCVYYYGDGIKDGSLTYTKNDKNDGWLLTFYHYDGSQFRAVTLNFKKTDEGIEYETKLGKYNGNKDRMPSHEECYPTYIEVKGKV